MTVPGVGALVAITFTSAVDDPGRFARSRAVGAHFGLTPKKYQSGETDVTGGISKVGDAMVRSALYEAANVMLTRAGRFSSLKRWALEVAKRRGMKRAKVALARKLASVLHRMWVDGSELPLRQGGRPPRDRLTRRQVSEQGRTVLLHRGPVAGTREPVKPVIREWPRLQREPRAPRLARRSRSDGMMWRHSADHGRKHEPGGGMITRGT